MNPGTVSLKKSSTRALKMKSVTKENAREICERLFCVRPTNLELATCCKTDIS